MSYSFKLAGTNKAMIKAAVSAANAPQNVKDRICDHVDAIELRKLNNGEPSQIILVEASGHQQEPCSSPSYGETTERSLVHVVEFHGSVPKAEPEPEAVEAPAAVETAKIAEQPAAAAAASDTSTGTAAGIADAPAAS